MTDELSCTNGCTRKNADGNREPVQATHGRYCKSCHIRIDGWLREIPDRYAELPWYLIPGVSKDQNPETKTTKKPVAPPPVSIVVLDLMDNRRGRKWLGTVPSEDRRGAVGTLLAWSTMIRAGRNTSTRLKPTVSREADTIRKNLDWAAEQESAGEMYTEIKVLHRELGDAIGMYPPRPVGRCVVVIEGTDAECGGPLLPRSASQGVHCPWCNAGWDNNDLRRLGMVLGEVSP